MELYHLFLIKPQNEIARLRLTGSEGNQYVEIIYDNRQWVFKVHDQDSIEDFYTDISQEWVQFVIESPTEFLKDQVMDEYVLFLN